MGDRELAQDLFAVLPARIRAAGDHPFAEIVDRDHDRPLPPPGQDPCQSGLSRSGRTGEQNDAAPTHANRLAVHKPLDPHYALLQSLSTSVEERPVLGQPVQVRLPGFLESGNIVVKDLD